MVKIDQKSDFLFFIKVDLGAQNNYRTCFGDFKSKRIQYKSYNIISDTSERIRYRFGKGHQNMSFAIISLLNYNTISIMLILLDYKKDNGNGKVFHGIQKIFEASNTF